MFRDAVNKALKDHKIVTPLTKDGFVKLCNALNMHCSQVLAYEGLLFCRGPQGEQAPPEDFDMDRLIRFLREKAKIVPPADNPRIARQQGSPGNFRRN